MSTNVIWMLVAILLGLSNVVSQYTASQWRQASNNWRQAYESQRSLSEDYRGSLRECERQRSN